MYRFTSETPSGPDGDRGINRGRCWDIAPSFGAPATISGPITRGGCSILEPIALAFVQAAASEHACLEHTIRRFK